MYVSEEVCVMTYFGFANVSLNILVRNLRNYTISVGFVWRYSISDVIFIGLILSFYALYIYLCFVYILIAFLVSLCKFPILKNESPSRISERMYRSKHRKVGFKPFICRIVERSGVRNQLGVVGLRYPRWQGVSIPVCNRTSSSALYF